MLPQLFVGEGIDPCFYFLVETVPKASSRVAPQ